MAEFSQPVDPDVDLHVEPYREELRVRPYQVLSAISAGGVVGALGRYGLTTAFPHQPADFDWATFGINVSGCLLIGVLMTLINEVWPGRPLLRPFLGVGVLGGFTTFSAYTVDIQRGLSAGAPGIALAYLAGTLLAAMVAVYLGSSVTRSLVASRRAG